jgi:hypothetical protein
MIPGNAGDRTGTAGILRRALAEINRRFAGLQAEILAIFARVPSYAVGEMTANDVVLPRVAYGLTPEQMGALAAELLAALERWVASGRDPANQLWWSRYVAEASQLGLAQSAANLTNLSAAYAGARSLETVLYSAPYRNRLAFAQLKSYEHWTGQTAEIRTRLSQIIGRAVVDGKNPKAVVTEIADALEVSRSKARQFAQTDITDTLRGARIAEDEAAEEDLGIRTGLLWTSAFKPTTRPWHASRSGKVYTRDEVRAFYERDGNRYNCFCAVTSCLLDAAGKPILTDGLKVKMRAERERWERENLAT